MLLKALKKAVSILKERDCVFVPVCAEGIEEIML
jgi:hypothetical protein